MLITNQVRSWTLFATLATCFAPVLGRYAITGVKTGINSATGARPARKNILDLQNDVPTWYLLLLVVVLSSLLMLHRSLYIQALVKMQQTPEDELLSWFQVAGTDTQLPHGI